MEHNKISNNKWEISNYFLKLIFIYINNNKWVEEMKKKWENKKSEREWKKKKKKEKKEEKKDILYNITKRKSCVTLWKLKIILNYFKKYIYIFWIF